MPRAASLAAALAAVALAGCATVGSRAGGHEAEVAPAPSPATPAAAGPSEPEPPETAADTAADVATSPPPDGRLGGGSLSDARVRLATRARSFLGKRGPFAIAGERFNDDCSGFAQAVYAAEGVDLRGLMQRIAPGERRGVKAAWLAAQAEGRVLGAGERPEPGDLVFWHDTYDRNRNGKADDRFTHLGVVEHVEDGTVTFLHRGAKGVARGVMTLARRRQSAAPDGRRLNSVLRSPAHPVKGGGLAGQLFAGYARLGEPRVAVGGDRL